jgi:hypothetical protein
MSFSNVTFCLLDAAKTNVSVTLTSTNYADAAQFMQTVTKWVELSIAPVISIQPPRFGRFRWPNANSQISPLPRSGAEQSSHQDPGNS